MDDPFAVLGLDPRCSEAQVRQKYLELVRAHPPDRAPEQFARIRAAYDEVRDPTVRLQRLLFGIKSTDSLAEVLQEAARRVRARRIPTAGLLALADGP